MYVQATHSGGCRDAGAEAGCRNVMNEATQVPFCCLFNKVKHPYNFIYHFLFGSKDRKL